MASYYPTHVTEPLVADNTFRGATPEDRPLPLFADVRGLLPVPHWPAQPDALACYWRSWELAFANLRRPTAANGFVANYIDTAFNQCLFMWDSAFILLFARYGARAFDFQRTLDNLYAKQHADGFICREIRESDGGDQFERFDPSSTGPNLLPWCEWEYYGNFGDRERLARVFAPLLAYYRWFRRNRTWPDGTYWSSGWGCGMDNQPRLPAGAHVCFSHGHMTWLDTTLQQVFTARVLGRMATELGRSEEAADLAGEADTLARFVNQRLWDRARGFYFDRFRDGSLGQARSIGAYWSLLAGVAPAVRAKRLLALLDDPTAFARPHRVPTLAADDPHYDPKGGYWLGAVWPPTTYMVLRGLTQYRAHEQAYRIARNHVDQVTEVFRATGTVWENYAPESAAPGEPARRDFVGWSGLGPIAVLYEYVFGLQPDVAQNTLHWHLHLADEHGVTRYPFGRDGLLTLHCAARTQASDPPQITATSTVPLLLHLHWPGGQRRMALAASAG